MRAFSHSLCTVRSDTLCRAPISAKENPQKNFMPSVGRIKTWRTPDAVDGLRIDAGYRSGDAVSPYYDAMLAKVIAWAPTRQAAIERLNRGLEETDVRGIVYHLEGGP